MLPKENVGYKRQKARELELRKRNLAGYQSLLPNRQQISTEQHARQHYDQRKDSLVQRATTNKLKNNDNGKSEWQLDGCS